MNTLIAYQAARKNGPGLIELAEQMLQEVKDWFPQRQFMTSADGFYVTLAGRGATYTHLISRIRCDAAIYELPKKKRKHQRGPNRKKGDKKISPRRRCLRRRRGTIEKIKGNSRKILVLFV